MPAKSKAQQQAMAIAEHHPEKLNKANRGMLSMSHKQLHEFASGSEKGKPEHVKKVERHGTTKEHMQHLANREEHLDGHKKGHGSDGRDDGHGVDGLKQGHAVFGGKRA
jgi:uncharacterized protein DUF3008